MPVKQSDYTMLPFYDGLLSAKLLLCFAALIIIITIIKTIIYRKSISIRQAPAAITFAYITAPLINMMFCTFLYWQWALALSAVISVIFAFTTAGEVKDANSDERMGIRGLNKDIRRIRGELFNDMSIEKQLEYRESVKPVRFSKILFIAITLIIPVLFIFVLQGLDIGYLLKPVLIN